MHNIFNPQSAKTINDATISVPVARDGISLEPFTFTSDDLEIISLGVLRNTSLEFTEPTENLATTILVAFNYSKEIAINETIGVTLPNFTIDSSINVISSATTCEYAVLTYSYHLGNNEYIFNIENNSIPANALCEFSVNGFKTPDAPVLANDVGYKKITIIAIAGSSGAIKFDAVDAIIDQGDLHDITLALSDNVVDNPTNLTFTMNYSLAFCFWGHH